MNATTPTPLTTDPSTPSPHRIYIIDTLRAFALLGILIVHTHDHFNLYIHLKPSVGWLIYADQITDWIYQHLFVSKAYLLFSFLFGISFFIQLDRRSKKGHDFRKTFIWRLILLIALGLIHTLFYDGDILTIFGILGMVLVAVYKLPNIIIWLLTVLCLLQPIAFWNVMINIFSNNPDLQIPSISFHLPNVEMQTREVIAQSHSWWKVAGWNFTFGQLGKWEFFIQSGRLWQTLGMFLLGMLAGRYRIFEQMDNVDFFKKLAIWSAGLFCFILIVGNLPWILQDVGISHSTTQILSCWQNIAFMGVFISLIIIIFTRQKMKTPNLWMSAAGKITLTCYLSQSIIFTPIFFNWGFGLAYEFNSFYCLSMSLVTFTIQVILCNIWLRYMLYGPIEWLWRSATLRQWQPLLNRHSRSH